MKLLRWRPIAETPRHAREMTAMICCIDEHDTYLLPGPVVWDTSSACWTQEDTGQAVRYQTDATYRWIPEADLLS